MKNKTCTASGFTLAHLLPIFGIVAFVIVAELLAVVIVKAIIDRNNVSSRFILDGSWNVSGPVDLNDEEERQFTYTLNRTIGASSPVPLAAPANVKFVVDLENDLKIISINSKIISINRLTAPSDIDDGIGLTARGTGKITVTVKVEKGADRLQDQGTLTAYAVGRENDTRVKKTITIRMHTPSP